MKFASGEQIGLRVLALMQNIGSWVCIGAGIILIMAGIVFAVQSQARALTVASGVLHRRPFQPGIFRSVMCFAIGGTLAFGGWQFVTELSRNMYLQALSLVAERNSDSDLVVTEIRTISDVPLKEPSVDEVLTAFESSGGVLADGFRNSIEKVPDILGSMNRILVRAGLSPIDEKTALSAITLIQTGKNPDNSNNDSDNAVALASEETVSETEKPASCCASDSDGSCADENSETCAVGDSGCVNCDDETAESCADCAKENSESCADCAAENTDESGVSDNA